MKLEIFLADKLNLPWFGVADLSCIGSLGGSKIVVVEVRT
jgi:hypothetical protein